MLFKDMSSEWSQRMVSATEVRKLSGWAAPTTNIQSKQPLALIRKRRRLSF